VLHANGRTSAFTQQIASAQGQVIAQIHCQLDADQAIPRLNIAGVWIHPLCIFLHCAGLAGLNLESVLLLKLPELAMMGLAMRFLVCSTRL